MAVRTANVNVRVEQDVKEQAEAILAQLGVSVSSFINMTYRQVSPIVVRTRWYSPSRAGTARVGVSSYGVRKMIK